MPIQSCIVMLAEAHTEAESLIVRTGHDHFCNAKKGLGLICQEWCLWETQANGFSTVVAVRSVLVSPCA